MRCLSQSDAVLCGSILRRYLFALLVCFAANVLVLAGDGNRLAYLDSNEVWYPHQDFPKLITPQWVGEEGVECVVTLAIDDMRDTAKYEAYLRPILQRLKQIDGRAPVSIMTNSVKPDDPQLQTWLQEGLSLECHTADHPCPLLQGGQGARAEGRGLRGKGRRKAIKRMAFLRRLGTFEKLLPHQPPRASVRFPQEPWASALRLIVTSDNYFSNGP